MRAPAEGTAPTSPSWSARYGERHRQVRIVDFPSGIDPPEKVRLYRRSDHYILGWWDPAAKRNLCDRVDGDLVAAIARAREIEERLVHFRRGGVGRRTVRHGELVELFVADLRQRAEAGEIAPATARRYAAALEPYLRYVGQPAVSAAFPSATNVNRDFALGLAAFLRERQPAGRRGSNPPSRYANDVVRALFAWAEDPDRGGLMPTGFRNPFAGRRRRTDAAPPDLFGEPDIDVGMAAAFLRACDAWQLPLFGLLALYGLRAAEPCVLFREDLVEGTLQVGCRPEIAALTKGRRSKRLPLVEPLATWLAGDGTPGLLFRRRTVLDGVETAPLAGYSVEEIRQEFERRCRRVPHVSAEQREGVRDDVLRAAGGLTYDRIEGEFQRVARSLGWSAAATLKDFRHLFSTSLENGGLPLFYRRYLMGQAPGRSAITTYTHLNDLRNQYETAARRTLAPVLDALVERGRALGLPVPS